MLELGISSQDLTLIWLVPTDDSWVRSRFLLHWVDRNYMSLIVNYQWSIVGIG